MSRDPMSCKLEIDGQTSDQFIEIKYLGVILSSYGDIEKKSELTELQDV